eukprot:CAMPEP_0201574808 /NCGR_PEP_ID=MMETSP0190_2-20130828/19545_1 /ASSEMBLY_ACC=CAM_ASM_000263 /TAXON_ID=37353 /ORGANISM="Rosalina sp." /LENGTH=159 /DNA_ID=CAMNT_0048003575 /DNA_START=90 /DNA_END=566 /DNA_ORIENTATION=+
MELLVAGGLILMGYTWRDAQKKKYEDKETAEAETQLVEVKTALQETEKTVHSIKTELDETKKKYIELTIKFTKTQLIGVALFTGCTVIAYFAYRAYQRQKEAEERAEEVLNMDNAWQCVSCLDNEKTVVYLPCNHLAVCQKCDQDMSQSNLEEPTSIES